MTTNRPLERPNTSPLVSVGMPVYNGERWMRRAIDSILAQTYRNLELVISDNTSIDATEKICRDYAERDSRVRYHRNPENVGLNNNYSLAFRRSAGKYFKWSSSNDFCAPRLLELCVARLEANPDIVLCYSKTRIFREDGDAGDPYEDDLGAEGATPCDRMKQIFARLRLNNAVNGVIRADVLKHTDLIADYFSSDNVLIVDLALHGKLSQVPEELFYRRIAEGASTALQSDEERLAYFQPAQRRRMLFQTWKLNWGYFVAASRAPLALRDRACVYGHMLRRAIWSRRDLARDIQLATRTAFGASRRR